MPTPRSTAVLAGALALATALSVAVAAAPAPATAAAVAPKTVQAPTVARTAVSGQPPKNFAIQPGTYFSFPNRTAGSRVNIRNRVLNTVMSTWGGPKDSLHQPVAGNGKIRMATWSFNDMTMARALVAARNRGVSVQVVAAATANVESASWTWLKRQLGAARYVPGHPATTETQSFARQCRGACRGRGGTPHSKYFLFDNVGQLPPAQHRGADLDEPDDVRVPGPVEPGPRHAQRDGLQPLPGDLQASPCRGPGPRRLPPLHLPQRDRHVLPEAGHQCLGRPGDAGAQPSPLPWRRHRLGSHQDPDHPVRHLRHARRLDRQEAAQPVELRLQRRGHLLRVDAVGDEDPAQPLRSRSRSRCVSRSPRTARA